MSLLLRIELFGHALTIEWARTQSSEPDECPHDLSTPMVTYADDRHEWARDFSGFVAAERSIR